MSRPRADDLDLLARAVEVLRAEPELAARPEELRMRLGARRSRVRAVLSALRRFEGTQLPAARRGRPKKSAPNSEGGS